MQDLSTKNIRKGGKGGESEITENINFERKTDYLF